MHTFRDNRDFRPPTTQSMLSGPEEVIIDAESLIICSSGAIKTSSMFTITIMYIQTCNNDYTIHNTAISPPT